MLEKSYFTGFYDHLVMFEFVMLVVLLFWYRNFSEIFFLPPHLLLMLSITLCGLTLRPRSHF